LQAHVVWKKCPGSVDRDILRRVGRDGGGVKVRLGDMQGGGEFD
jgi:hypothetical protein